MSEIVTTLLGREVEMGGSHGRGTIVSVSLEDGIFYYTIELHVGKLVNKNFDAFTLLPKREVSE